MAFTVTVKSSFEALFFTLLSRHWWKVGVASLYLIPRSRLLLSATSPASTVLARMVKVLWSVWWRMETSQVQGWGPQLAGIHCLERSSYIITLARATASLSCSPLILSVTSVNTAAASQLLIIL